MSSVTEIAPYRASELSIDARPLQLVGMFRRAWRAWRHWTLRNVVTANVRKIDIKYGRHAGDCTLLHGGDLCRCGLDDAIEALDPNMNEDADVDE